MPQPTKKQLDDFFAWCAGEAKKGVTGKTMNTLSRDYIREKRLNLKPHHFGGISEEDIFKMIKKNRPTVPVKAKLICLFGLSVNQDYLEELHGKAEVKLDKHGRIIKFQSINTKFECRHGSKKMKRSEVAGNVGDEVDDAGNGMNEEFDLNAANQALLANFISAQSSSQPTLSPFHRQNVAGSMTASITSERPLLPNEFSDSEMTPISSLEDIVQRINQAEGIGAVPFQLSTHEHNLGQVPTQGLELFAPSAPRAIKLENGEFHVATSSSPIAQYDLKSALGKLESFFLYKFNPDLSTLCLRIRDVKTMAERSRKIITKSTIKSYFEVALRGMTNKSDRHEGIKIETGETEKMFSLFGFLQELEKQDIVYGLRRVIENITIDARNEKEISMNTVCEVFLKLVNDLAGLC